MLDKDEFCFSYFVVHCIEQRILQKSRDTRDVCLYLDCLCVLVLFLVLDHEFAYACFLPVGSLEQVEAVGQISEVQFNLPGS